MDDKPYRDVTFDVACARPPFADKFEFFYTQDKPDGFIGPMPAIPLKEGDDYYNVWARSHDDNHRPVFPLTLFNNVKFVEEFPPTGRFAIVSASDFQKRVEAYGSLVAFLEALEKHGYSGISLVPDDWRSRDPDPDGAWAETHYQNVRIIDSFNAFSHHAGGPMKKIHQAFLDLGHHFTEPEMQDEVVPKNRPKGPVRSKNQRGGWWNR